MKRTPKQLIAVFVFALVMHMAILVQGVLVHSPNIDEIAHLPAGVAYWKFQTFEMYNVNPPLVGWLTCWPAWMDETEFDWNLRVQVRDFRPEFAIARRALTLYKLDYYRHFIIPRLLATLFSVIGCCLFCRTVWNVLGAASSVVSCILWCSLPNFLAHAQIVGHDMASVTAIVLCGASSFRYATRPSFSGAIAVGTCVGLAMLTKLTWITTLISVPFAIATGRCVIIRSLLPLRSSTLWGDELMVLVSAITVLNAGYLFEGTLESLDERAFLSVALGGADKTRGETGNRFEGTLLGKVPLPVPKQYVLGIDYLRYEIEGKYWSFLNGDWKFGSWPYYYIMTTLYKTPEPTMVGALIGLGVLLIGIRRKMVKPEVISMFLFLGIPAMVAFVSVSWQGGFNHHHRYVLMIYPAMFAMAAYIASPVGVQLLRFRLPFLGPDRRSIAVPFALTLAVLSTASSLRVHPHYTSYFNTLSGGPENGWRLLGFSNIDWGQDILEVDKWLKVHPDRRPLVMDIDYFGMNGNLFDVPTSDPPQLPKGASIDEVRRSITQTQWWIISVKKLYNLPNRPGLEYLQQIHPVERIAYAYHVYRIDPLPADLYSSDPNIAESESSDTKPASE
ncbi:MAG: glycosyltransferase family 39 protein [Planctomycetota bacterium]|nr:glycosyltransferase family 39 protein [Planctomycetota bacterium]